MASGFGGPDATRELTEGVASGDAAAFERFYRAWFDRVFIEARRATGRDESFCLDVVQDAMMKVVRAIPVLESEAALAAWLRRCVLTTARDRIRSEARRAERERRAARSERGAGVQGTDARAGFAAGFDAESLREVEQRLAALDESSAHLVTARFRFGWTLERIAQSLGLRTGAADGRLSRLLARWRDELGRDDSGRGKGGAS